MKFNDWINSPFAINSNFVEFCYFKQMQDEGLEYLFEMAFQPPEGRPYEARKIPYVFDKNDLWYLIQFPQNYWATALSYRRNEGLYRLTQELKKEGFKWGGTGVQKLASKDPGEHDRNNELVERYKKIREYLDTQTPGYEWVYLDTGRKNTNWNIFFVVTSGGEAGSPSAQMYKRIDTSVDENWFMNHPDNSPEEREEYKKKKGGLYGDSFGSFDDVQENKKGDRSKSYYQWKGGYIGTSRAAATDALADYFRMLTPGWFTFTKSTSPTTQASPGMINFHRENIGRGVKDLTKKMGRPTKRGAPEKIMLDAKSLPLWVNTLNKRRAEELESVDFEKFFQYLKNRYGVRQSTKPTSLLFKAVGDQCEYPYFNIKGTQLTIQTEKSQIPWVVPGKIIHVSDFIKYHYMHDLARKQATTLSVSDTSLEGFIKYYNRAAEIEQLQQESYNPDISILELAKLLHGQEIWGRISTSKGIEEAARFDIKLPQIGPKTKIKEEPEYLSEPGSTEEPESIEEASTGEDNPKSRKTKDWEPSLQQIRLLQCALLFKKWLQEKKNTLSPTTTQDPLWEKIHSGNIGKITTDHPLSDQLYLTPDDLRTLIKQFSDESKIKADNVMKEAEAGDVYDFNLGYFHQEQHEKWHTKDIKSGGAIPQTADPRVQYGSLSLYRRLKKDIEGGKIGRFILQSISFKPIPNLGRVEEFLKTEFKKTHRRENHYIVAMDDRKAGLIPQNTKKEIVEIINKLTKLNFSTEDYETYTSANNDFQITFTKLPTLGTRHEISRTIPSLVDIEEDEKFEGYRSIMKKSIAGWLSKRHGENVKIMRSLLGSMVDAALSEWLNRSVLIGPFSNLFAKYDRLWRAKNIEKVNELKPQIEQAENTIIKELRNHGANFARRIDQIDLGFGSRRHGKRTMGSLDAPIGQSEKPTSLAAGITAEDTKTRMDIRSAFTMPIDQIKAELNRTGGTARDPQELLQSIGVANPKVGRLTNSAYRYELFKRLAQKIDEEKKDKADKIAEKGGGIYVSTFVEKFISERLSDEEEIAGVMVRLMQAKEMEIAMATPNWVSLTDQQKDTKLKAAFKEIYDKYTKDMEEGLKVSPTVLEKAPKVAATVKRGHILEKIREQLIGHAKRNDERGLKDMAELLNLLATLIKTHGASAQNELLQNAFSDPEFIKAAEGVYKQFEKIHEDRLKGQERVVDARQEPYLQFLLKPGALKDPEHLRLAQEVVSQGTLGKRKLSDRLKTMYFKSIKDALRSVAV